MTGLVRKAATASASRSRWPERRQDDDRRGRPSPRPIGSPPPAPGRRARASAGRSRRRRTRHPRAVARSRASSDEPVARRPRARAARAGSTRIRRFVALSSTTRTPPAAQVERRRVGDGGLLDRRDAGQVDDEPERAALDRGSPALSATSEPSISSARRRLIASPRPVPPYRLEIDASAWLNDWNSRPDPVGRDADARVVDVEADRPAGPAARRRRLAGVDPRTA